MARLTELTQEIINNTADELHSKGVKPSPNNVREILGKGSYSTIKKMLDGWKEKQQENEHIVIPQTPDFAYHIVDKLHKELYLQNRKLLDSERQQLELLQQEMEGDKAEMMTEINQLESTIESLTAQGIKTEKTLTSALAEIEKFEDTIKKHSDGINKQKIEIATLTEREKQQKIQLKEKEGTIKQAEKTNQALQKQIEELMKNLSK